MHTNAKTEGTIASRDGTTIAFDRAGDGPPLILVDGAMCYRRAGPTWLHETAQALADHLPDARHLGLFGQFHDVDPAMLAPYLKEFLVG